MRYLIGFFGLFLLLSCEKQEQIYLQVDDYGKEWGQFSKGSYWIFRNDSTSELIDTIKYINAGTNHLLRYDSVNNEDFVSDRLQTYLSIEYTEESKVSIFFDGMIYVDATKEISLVEDYFSFGIRVIDLKFRYDDDGIISEVNQADEAVQTVEYIDKLNVNGIDYYDVVHFKSESLQPDETEFYNSGSVTCINNYEYWIAKNKWIIKRVLHFDGKTVSYSLVESSTYQ